MSPMMSMPALRALAAILCGAGKVDGMPGESTSALTPARSALARSVSAMPRAAAASRLAGASSQASTRAPPRFNASAAARPERASPRTATLSLRKAVTSIIALSPQLQRREAGDREDRGDDPETNDDGWLLPALALEMVVERRHAEDALSRELGTCDLNDDRDGLQDEQAADNGEHELVFCNDRHGAQRGADRERSGVAHENARRGRIEPQKAQARADHRGAKDRELARARHVLDLQIVGKDRVADEIGDQHETSRRDHRRHDRQAVETIGEIDGVRRADHDEHRHRHEKPAERDENGLEERNDEGGAERRARDVDDRIGRDHRDEHLGQD